MILATLFGKLLKIWVVIRGDAILLLFLDCSAKLVVLCNASFSHQVKFYSFVFMHNISTLVVCVNGKHPWSLPFFPLGSLHRPIFSIQTPDTGHCRYPIHDKKTWHVLGKVQASREFLGVGAHASLDILKNWNFLKAAFRVFSKKSTQYIRQKWNLRTIYSEIDLRCQKWHWFE